MLQGMQTIGTSARNRLLLLVACCLSVLWPTLVSAQNNPFSSCRAQQSLRMLGQSAAPIPDRANALRWTLSGSVRRHDVVGR
jgi:hypothetical protein